MDLSKVIGLIHEHTDIYELLDIMSDNDMFDRKVNLLIVGLAINHYSIDLANKSNMYKARVRKAIRAKIEYADGSIDSWVMLMNPKGTNIIGSYKDYKQVCDQLIKVRIRITQ